MKVEASHNSDLDLMVLVAQTVFHSAEEQGDTLARVIHFLKNGTEDEVVTRCKHVYE